METWVGISDTALQWFRSYMKDECFCIGIADARLAATGVIAVGCPRAQW